MESSLQQLVVLFQAHMDVLDKLMQGLQDQVQNVSLQVANLTQSQQHLEAYVTQQVRCLGSIGR